MVHEKVGTVDIPMKRRSFDGWENDSADTMGKKGVKTENGAGGWNVLHSKSTYGKDNHIRVTERG